MAGAYRLIIRNYLLQSFGLDTLADDLDIFESGVGNSLFAIQLMTFLEKNAHIKITSEDLDLGNFKSVNAICDFIDRKKRAQVIA